MMNKITIDTSYMIFVLGYDLLQQILTEVEDCPCDWAYRVCERVYDEFLKSEENLQDKSEYECLQDWIANHMERVEYIMDCGGYIWDTRPLIKE